MGSVQLLCSQPGDKFRSVSHVSFQHPSSRETSYWGQVLLMLEITSSQKIKQKLRMLLQVYTWNWGEEVYSPLWR